jgi:hypothetical protein
VPQNSHSGTQPGVGIAELLVGAVMMGYGVLMLSRRRTVAASTELPRLLRRITAVKPPAALGMALALNLRPKAILLSAAVGLVIGSAVLEGWQDAIALGAYVVVGTSTVAVPIILCLANPERAKPPLRAAQAWIEKHGRSVTFVVALVVGTVILGDGVGRL